MFGVTPPLVALLLAYALLVTVAANVAVAWRRWGGAPWRTGTGTGGSAVAGAPAVVGGVVWAALLFAAGLVAVRYSERLPNPLAGYLLFGILALGLSLVEAFIAQGGPRPVRSRQSWASLVHPLVYLLAAAVIYFLLTWAAGRTVLPGPLLLLFLGALLPDLDSPRSPPGRLLPFVSRYLANRLGQGGGWHSLAAALLVAVVFLPLILISPVAWYVVPLGFVAHLLVDLLRPEGVQLFWPVRDTRYSVRGGPLGAAGSRAEGVLALVLAVAAGLLLVPLDVGPPPPPAAPALTYEQNLDRYYSLRGRSLVFAYVQGTWQATGRRVSGRFEVLNARGASFIMLDRYTRQVFSAGHSAQDNLYVSYMSLETGSAVEVKPAEVSVRDGRLGDVLSVVYDMQQEPGLQYIYAAGEVILPEAEPSGPLTPTLPLVTSPTALRRFDQVAPRQYRLDYVEAADLIALANLPVAEGALVIVATYVVPATGPTPTPLPLLEPSP